MCNIYHNRDNRYHLLYRDYDMSFSYRDIYCHIASNLTNFQVHNVMFTFLSRAIISVSIFSNLTMLCCSSVLQRYMCHQC